MGSKQLIALGCALLAAAVTVVITGVAAAAPLPSAPACPVFPATNVWNKRVDTLPVAANSATMINAIGAQTGVHPDFGSYLGYGIPPFSPA